MAALTMLKTALVAPIPKARVATAAAVSPERPHPCPSGANRSRRGGHHQTDRKCLRHREKRRPAPRLRSCPGTKSMPARLGVAIRTPKKDLATMNGLQGDQRPG